jgi:hypothetical protein
VPFGLRELVGQLLHPVLQFGVLERQLLGLPALLLGRRLRLLGGHPSVLCRLLGAGDLSEVLLLGRLPLLLPLPLSPSGGRLPLLRAGLRRRLLRRRGRRWFLGLRRRNQPEVRSHRRRSHAAVGHRRGEPPGEQRLPCLRIGHRGASVSSTCDEIDVPTR